MIRSWVFETSISLKGSAEGAERVFALRPKSFPKLTASLVESTADRLKISVTIHNTEMTQVHSASTPRKKPPGVAHETYPGQVLPTTTNGQPVSIADILDRCAVVVQFRQGQLRRLRLCDDGRSVELEVPTFADWIALREVLGAPSGLLDSADEQN